MAFRSSGEFPMKRMILVLCDYYLPGIKAGGGLWTVHNMIERLSDRYEFRVVCRNHDGRGDRTPFTDVATGKWNVVGSSQVMYLNPESITQRTIATLISEIQPDMVFLNSVFSRPTRKFLLARRRGLIPDLPVVLATTGELAKRAIAGGWLKKRAFLAFSRLFHLYRGIVWRASSALEKAEAKREFGMKADVLIAPDLTPRSILPEFDRAQKPAKSPGSARFICVGRVSRLKNIKFLLSCFAEIENGNIDLELVGPHEDGQYWSDCLDIIDRLPPNITVRPLGGLPNSEVLEKMTKAHFFILPTLNENFGYVFLEALAAGCPLLISDVTVWNDIEARNAGLCVSTNDRMKWIEAIERYVAADQAQYDKWSHAARDYAVDYLSGPEIEQPTIELLEHALLSSRKTE
jgi:glycosyltransferase involved in cell wall biosynthesis